MEHRPLSQLTLPCRREHIEQIFHALRGSTSQIIPASELWSLVLQLEQDALSSAGSTEEYFANLARGLPSLRRQLLGPDTAGGPRANAEPSRDAAAAAAEPTGGRRRPPGWTQPPLHQAGQHPPEAAALPQPAAPPPLFAPAPPSLQAPPRRSSERAVSEQQQDGQPLLALDHDRRAEGFLDLRVEEPRQPQHSSGSHEGSCNTSSHVADTAADGESLSVGSDAATSASAPPQQQHQQQELPGRQGTRMTAMEGYAVRQRNDTQPDVMYGHAQSPPRPADPHQLQPQRQGGDALGAWHTTGNEPRRTDVGFAVVGGGAGAGGLHPGSGCVRGATLDDARTYGDPPDQGLVYNGTAKAGAQCGRTSDPDTDGTGAATAGVNDRGMGWGTAAAGDDVFYRTPLPQMDLAAFEKLGPSRLRPRALESRAEAGAQGDSGAGHMQPAQPALRLSAPGYRMSPPVWTIGAPSCPNPPAPLLPPSSITQPNLPPRVPQHAPQDAKSFIEAAAATAAAAAATAVAAANAIAAFVQGAAGGAEQELAAQVMQAEAGCEPYVQHYGQPMIPSARQSRTLAHPHEEALSPGELQLLQPLRHHPPAGGPPAIGRDDGGFWAAGQGGCQRAMDVHMSDVFETGPAALPALPLPLCLQRQSHPVGPVCRAPSPSLGPTSVGTGAASGAAWAAGGGASCQVYALSALAPQEARSRRTLQPQLLGRTHSCVAAMAGAAAGTGIGTVGGARLGSCDGAWQTEAVGMAGWAACGRQAKSPRASMETRSPTAMASPQLPQHHAAAAASMSLSHPHPHRPASCRPSSCGSLPGAPSSPQVGLPAMTTWQHAAAAAGPPPWGRCHSYQAHGLGGDSGGGGSSRSLLAPALGGTDAGRLDELATAPAALTVDARPGAGSGLVGLEAFDPALAVARVRRLRAAGGSDGGAWNGVAVEMSGGRTVSGAPPAGGGLLPAPCVLRLRPLAPGACRPQGLYPPPDDCDVHVYGRTSDAAAYAGRSGSHPSLTPSQGYGDGGLVSPVSRAPDASTAVAGPEDEADAAILASGSWAVGPSTGLDYEPGFAAEAGLLGPSTRNRGTWSAGDPQQPRLHRSSAGGNSVCGVATAIAMDSVAAIEAMSDGAGAARLSPMGGDFRPPEEVRGASPQELPQLQSQLPEPEPQLERLLHKSRSSEQRQLHYQQVHFRDSRGRLYAGRPVLLRALGRAEPREGASAPVIAAATPPPLPPAQHRSAPHIMLFPFPAGSAAAPLPLQAPGSQPPHEFWAGAAGGGGHAGTGFQGAPHGQRQGQGAPRGDACAANGGELRVVNCGVPYGISGSLQAGGCDTAACGLQGGMSSWPSRSDQEDPMHAALSSGPAAAAGMAHAGLGSPQPFRAVGNAAPGGPASRFAVVVHSQLEQQRRPRFIVNCAAQASGHDGSPGLEGTTGGELGCGGSGGGLGGGGTGSVSLSPNSADDSGGDGSAAPGGSGGGGGTDSISLAPQSGPLEHVIADIGGGAQPMEYSEEVLLEDFGLPSGAGWGAS